MSTAMAITVAMNTHTAETDILIFWRFMIRQHTVGVACCLFNRALEARRLCDAGLVTVRPNAELGRLAAHTRIVAAVRRQSIFASDP
jgi:hypothetical protein